MQFSWIPERLNPMDHIIFPIDHWLLVSYVLGKITAKMKHHFDIYTNKPSYTIEYMRAKLEGLLISHLYYL